MGPLHTAILSEVRRTGQPLMNDLVDAVAHYAPTREHAVAAVAELVQDDRLTYSADARLRIPQ
jgi:hypothetical protein